MSDLFLLSTAQMRLIEPYFPLSHGVPRVDDRRIISAIIFVVLNGLRWPDVPREYGAHKTICNRFYPVEPDGCLQPDLCCPGDQRGKAGSAND